MKDADIGLGWIHQEVKNDKTLIDPDNRDIVHHLVLSECKPTAVFDDNSLPHGICDEITESIFPCFSSIASIWVVDDEIVEYSEIGGYPIGGDFEIKYYMFHMHYDNLDNSGVRFYLKKELRQYEFGYLTLGVDKTPFAIAIPPKADRFIFDSYYPAEPTQGDELATRCIYSTANKIDITLVK
ncbi:unnamed protein product [Rotaria sp. Silwood1]|nr:unnamed protein product [Rotaria sp. Silwood1]CAF3553442.1 unnamed protein product [Rotaria sp. Silwood1]CAF3655629.1 unnamed protein product [Rotaria sp. Silwood1]CAF4711998.1 unnamed protein product [Rotaria sp. Silwood1]CAF4749203.1 unnamed protein product [Rotaria sp. Silwood1]